MTFISSSSSRRIWRYLGATGIVAVSGEISDVFYRLTHTSRLSSIFLAGVLLSAFLFGSGPGYWASGLAFIVYLWLVDPRYKFEFGSAEDFDTLMVFLAVAILIGLLIGRIRDEAAAARRRVAAADALLEATRELSDATDEAFIRDRLARRVSAYARGPAFVREGLNVRTWPEEALDREVAIATGVMERRARGCEAVSFPVGAWTCRPLRVGEERYGVVGWRTDSGGPVTKEEAAMIDVLIDTAAAAIARTRLAAAKSEAEARARTEDLRNALLSSISHDVRTPLAAILASASSLQEFGEGFDVATRRDLAATIQEEAVRLDAFVANLLSMSRLEAGALNIRVAPFSVSEVVARAADVRARSGAAVSLEVAAGLPEAIGDPRLFEQALANVLENALRYGDGSPVTIAAARDEHHIRVEVRDRGPGVAQGDVDRIFEKFFRAPANAALSGTGLGLAIARGLIEAMGGGVSARNLGDRDGLAVVISLPVAA